jgi:hypothetical protein
MPVTIREITTEVVLGPDPGSDADAPVSADDHDALVERIARSAYERVLEHLRRTWEP